MSDRHRYTLRNHSKMASSFKRARVPTPPGTTTMSGFGTYVSIPITSNPLNHSNSRARKIYSSFHFFFSIHSTEILQRKTGISICVPTTWSKEAVAWTVSVPRSV